jgi:small-conductance mechanosensitive channel
MSVAAGPPVETVVVDPTEQADLLLRDLHTDLHGLSQREADRRLVRFGRNELVRRGGRRWPRQLVQQFTHPLALLLAAAAVLAVVAGIAVLAAAIAAVIVLNAALLVRAWLFLGMISAALVMAGFFYVLLSAGWRPGDAVGKGSALHHAYLQATTMTFVGTAPLGLDALLFVTPFPLVVWGADELRRWVRRRRADGVG